MNFPVWLPDHWRTVADFLSGEAILHSGYSFQGRVWENAMSATPGGLSIWFYSALSAAVLTAPFLTAIAVHPLPSLCRNMVGERLSSHALWFPPDELYDVGLREAVHAVTLRAEPGARLMTEAPAVVSFYAVAYGRSDLEVHRLSGARPIERDWELVQDGRVYLENRAILARAKQSPPVVRVWAKRFSAVEVYRW